MNVTQKEIGHAGRIALKLGLILISLFISLFCLSALVSDTARGSHAVLAFIGLYFFPVFAVLLLFARSVFAAMAMSAAGLAGVFVLGGLSLLIFLPPSPSQYERDIQEVRKLQQERKEWEHTQQQAWDHATRSSNTREEVERRFRAEGYSDEDAATAADAVMRFDRANSD